MQADLFESPNSPSDNLLPHDGLVTYQREFFTPAEADHFLAQLLHEIPWQHDEVVMFGKTITTSRRVAWYGDRDYNYTYSGRTRTALIWTPELRALKEKIENQSNTSYNSCLLNLYDDGSQGMGWHQDNEKELGPNPNIASVSFGAERRFDFRHRETRKKVSLPLTHGSLLIMSGSTQTHWQHQIAKTKKVTSPRVNLTFRQIVTL